MPMHFSLNNKIINLNLTSSINSIVHLVLIPGKINISTPKQTLYELATSSYFMETDSQFYKLY